MNARHFQLHISHETLAHFPGADTFPSTLSLFPPLPSRGKNATGIFEAGEDKSQ